jgi:hypothetical protein
VASVIFGRAPSHRFGAGINRRGGKRGAPEEEGEGEAREEAQKHLVAPE